MNAVFLIEVGLVFGLVLALAGWEYWRTARKIREHAEKAEPGGSEPEELQ